MSTSDNLNSQQFSTTPDLTTQQVSGILSRTGLPRYKMNRGGRSTLRDVRYKVSETSGMHIEPEKQSFNVNPRDRRPRYVTSYSGRYAVSYRGGGEKHSPEDIATMLEHTKKHFINAGLQVTPHFNENTFWVSR